MTVKPHIEEDEKPGKDELKAMADKKKKKKLQELAEDRTKTKVDTWKSTTNR